EEIVDVVSPEDVEDTLVLVAVAGEMAELVTARADCRRGRPPQPLDCFCRFRPQVEQVFLHDAKDTVVGPEQVSDAIVAEGLLNYRVPAGVYDGGRPAGLSDHGTAANWIHVCRPPTGFRG